jgi:hypothetical protein
MNERLWSAKDPDGVWGRMRMKRGGTLQAEAGTALLVQVPVSGAGQAAFPCLP